MAAHLTLQLSFEETIVLVNALAHERDREETSDKDKQRAQYMLATIEHALERGPGPGESDGHGARRS